jgi:hypothetical protein
MADSSSMMMMMMMMMVFASMSLSMLAVGGMSMLPAQMQEVDVGDAGALDETTDEIPRAADGCVMLYEHRDGEGKNVGFCLDGEKEYRVNNLKSFDFNDTASSVDVGEGAQVLLYTDSELKGDMTRLKTGFHAIEDSWKDNVLSSLLIKKA